MRDGGIRSDEGKPERGSAGDPADPPARLPASKEAIMGLTQSGTLRSRSTHPSSHRTYVDKRGGPFVACDAVSDDELVEMAEAADRIEVRQADPHQAAASDLSPIMASLHALAWLDLGLVTDPAALRRAIRRKIGDQRTRFRLKTGRNLLAGTVTRCEAGRDQRILLVVLVGRGITSCDWQLAC
jgi:hypothetical protein